MTIPTPTTLFPDIDGMMNFYLRDALPGIQVGQLMPPPELRVYPFAMVRHVGGGRKHARLLGEASVAINGFAETRREARDTAESVVQVLEYAAENQVIVADDGAGRKGHIARLIVDQAPAEFRDTDQPAGIFRFLALVSFLVRP